MAHGIASWLGLGVAGSLLAGCALLSPLPKPAGLAERLAAFPTRGLPLREPVTVFWNERQIPFIDAATDDDAAFALGLVHAHLRLGQMVMMRMVAQGRLSEMAGPMAIDIDRGLRILSYGRAAADTERAMDESTRRWVQRFVDGINHYQNAAAELPHEFRVLGLEREPWTVADLLTVGRLSGTDVNWLVWADLLPLRGRQDWPELWARLVEKGTASAPSFDGDAAAGQQAWLGGLARSGSNSVALAPRHTTTGGAILANDPHIGIVIPNMWLIAGVRSPSCHAVGLMVPGFPLFAIGRNPYIAWGGTNMRAASSDLYDVSDLPESEITRRTEPIAVRWWLEADAAVRETRWGPILTDAPQLANVNLPPAALRWIGHRASDEIGAMRAVCGARDFDSFRRAFDSFAVPAQNMLYADIEGNIGQVMAAQLPRRDGAPADIVLDREVSDDAWTEIRSAGELPFSLNPESGFLASANNRPSAVGMPVGFFFSRDDRVRRIAALIEAETPLGVEAVAAIQRDVHARSSVELRDLFVAKLDAAGLGAPTDPARDEAVRRMRDWDGHYRPDSVGAVSFEQFRHGFFAAFFARAFGETDGQAYADPGRVETLLREDIETASEETVRAALAAGLDAAAAGVAAFDNWADMHRLQLNHPLSLVPVIGSRYRFAEYGVGGSSETLMKTAHDSSAGQHTVRYGANARHISDMTDPDANWFVLLGGQDGWLNSSTLLDQWALWRDGDYVRVPLTLGAVRESFPHVLTLGN